MYGFTRRDTENRLRAGISTYLGLFIAVFVACLYLFARMSGKPEPKLTSKEMEKLSVPTNVSTLNGPLNNWQLAKMDENGENVIVRQKDDRNVLSSQSAVYSPIQSVSFSEPAAGFRPKLSLGGIRRLTGDDGGSYVKSDFGIYSLNVPAGTELVGGKSSYLVGDDLKLYRIYDGGKRREVTSPLDFKLRDKSGRFYVTTKSMQLRLASPGGPGRFIGPDNEPYNILENGDIELVKTETIMPAIGGEGEFDGSDGKKYIVVNGLLFSSANSDVSFSKGAMGGKGFFVGPDGKTYVLGEDGKIYISRANGELVPANIGGSGSFTGPDGATYVKDENGDIRRVLGAGQNGTPQKTEIAQGYFIGPDGKTYYADENGAIFEIDQNGNMRPSAIGGNGSFVGPDGSRYNITDGRITPLKGKTEIAAQTKGNYLIGSDGKTYYVDENGKTFLVDKSGNFVSSELPKGSYKDAKGNLFESDGKGNIKRVSAGLPHGTSTGEDGKKYYVDDDGRFFLVDENGNLIPANPPMGILTSGNGRKFIVNDDGTIDEIPAENTESSGLDEGYFYAPDGSLKYSDGRGRIYNVAADGALSKAAQLPIGEFIGPDGEKYHIDEHGNIFAAKEKITEINAIKDIQPTAVSSPIPKKMTARVDVSANLQNYNTGDDKFSPAKEAAKLKGGRVYTLVAAGEDDTGSPKPATPSRRTEEGPFMPVGTRIPFYTLTHISTNLEQGSLIEAVVAENVFFHQAAIPAGTRIYGTAGDVGSNNRMKLSFSFLLYPNGKALPISADAYDVNMQYGIEAYYTPTPAWVYALRFLNVASIYGLTQNQGHSADGEPIGNIDEVVKYLNDTIKEIEHQQKGYYTLPSGTPGVLMLTANLNLTDVSIEGSSTPATKAEALLNEEERLKRMKFNVEQKRQQQLLEEAQKGIKIPEDGNEPKLPLFPSPMQKDTTPESAVSLEKLFSGK